MSKGLDALEKINHTICLAFNENNNALFNKDKFEHIDCKDIYEFIDCYNIIEKELKKAEKNEIVLNIFKNALTIEHHDLPMVDPHDDNEDFVTYAFKTLTTIRQNELDKSLRQALREWVLKNAFPKEFKALEIIKEIAKENMSNWGNIDFNINDYPLLKEVLL